ncbi:MAG: type II secretion system protein [Capsulimonadaceae bacterium]
MPPRNQNGFTIIELLVVVAIISIVSAIIFPVFASVRERARQTVCLSNVRQLAFAETMYLQDYDEVFWANPEPGDGVSAIDGCTSPACAGTTFWPLLLMPYLQTTRIFSCPDNGDPLFMPDLYQIPAIPPGSATSWTSPTAFRVTYGFADFGPHADATKLWTLSMLKSPAEIALLTDAVIPWNWPACELDPEKPAGIGSLYFAYGIDSYSFYGKVRHFNGMNFAYADGHAKYDQWVGASVPPGPQWAYGYYPHARVSDADCTSFDQ